MYACMYQGQASSSNWDLLYSNDFVCMYVCLYACMCVYVYVRVCMCMCVCDVHVGASLHLIYCTLSGSSY